MSTREIWGSDIDAETPYWQQCQEWLDANEVNVNEVLAEAPLTVDYAAKTLTVTQYAYDTRGKRMMHPIGNGIKVRRTVPLMSAPENHNI